MVREMRVPNISRDHRSRPCRSVPSRKILWAASRPPSTPDQVTRRGNHPEESILEAFGEEPDRDLLGGIRSVDPPEGLEVADALDGVDVGAKPPALEPVDGLRRHQGALRLGRIRVGIGEEVRAQHHQVEADDDDAAGHGDAMPLESPPREPPLRGHVEAPVLRGRDGARPVSGSARRIERHVGLGHQESSRRMRGSTHTRMNVRDQRADHRHDAEQEHDRPRQEHVLRDEGPQQERSDGRQSEDQGHDDAPRHDVRQRVADGAGERVEGEPDGVLQNHPELREASWSAPSPRRACAARPADWRA